METEAVRQVVPAALEVLVAVGWEAVQVDLPWDPASLEVLVVVAFQVGPVEVAFLVDLAEVASQEVPVVVASLEVPAEVASLEVLAGEAFQVDQVGVGWGPWAVVAAAAGMDLELG